MSIRYIQTNYNKIDCFNLVKFLLDLAVIDLENVKLYEQGKTYIKGDLVYLKENNIHRIYRCVVDVSSNTFIPNEWEHIFDIYDEKVNTGNNIYIREEDFFVNEDNIGDILDNIIVPNYKPGSTHVTIYIDKDIFVTGKDFVIDENGKVTFTPPINVEIGDKIIVEIRDIIGLPDKLIILSSNGNNYEIGVIGEDMFIIESDLKHSKPEIFVRDISTGENYRIFMLDEDVYFELTDIYTVQTEIKVLDADDNKYIIEMINGDLVFSPKE